MAMPIAESAATRPDDVHGILLLDKPLGLSSNEALQRVKRALGARKAGHSGSLDPLASGMLPVCLGEATKFAAILLGARKQYEFTVALGSRSSTGDGEGVIVADGPVPPLDDQAVQSVLRAFVGVREQVPPMHSALKFKGQRLYDLARRDIEVERAPRAVQIEALELVRLASPQLELRLTCSKGTYVRTLGEEVARALGTCGYVTRLHRTWVEPFATERLVSLEELERTARQDIEQARAWLLPTDRALAGWPRVDLNSEQTRRVLHGQTIPVAATSAPPVGPVRIYGPAVQGDGALPAAGAVQFLGTAEWLEPHFLRPRRLISAEPRNL